MRTHTCGSSGVLSVAGLVLLALCMEQVDAALEKLKVVGDFQVPPAHVWTTEIGSLLHSSPALVTIENTTDGVGAHEVVVQADYSGKVWGLSMSDGAVEWSIDVNDAIASSPAVVNTLLYFGCHDNYLHAIDVSTLEEVWRYPANDSIVSSPAVLQTDAGRHRIIFASYDGNVYQVDADDGSTLWSTHISEHDIASSPIVVAGRICIGTEDGIFYALDVDSGEVAWSTEVNGHVDTDAIGVNDLVCFGTVKGTFYCLRTGTGAMIWSIDQQHRISTARPSVWESTVFFGSQNSILYAVDVATGEVVWQVETLAPLMSALEVVNGVLYGGDAAGSFYAFDVHSGDVLWRYDADEAVYAFPVVRHNTIIFGSYDGNVVSIKLGTTTAPCPERDIWPSTLAGLSASIPCSSGVGNITRVCGDDGEWDQVDLSECGTRYCLGDDVWPLAEAGDVVELECPIGWDGVRRRECDGSGSYSDVTSECIRVYCEGSSGWPRTPSLLNATIPCPGSEGGVMYRLCGPDGTFDRIEPSECSSDVQEYINNATTSGSDSSSSTSPISPVFCPAQGEWPTAIAGATITLPCRLGVMSRSCQPNGSWSEIDESCIEILPEGWCDGGLDAKGMTWNRTKGGQVVRQACPAGYDGEVIRECIDRGTEGVVWGVAEHGLCHKSESLEISDEVKSFVDGPYLPVVVGGGVLLFLLLLLLLLRRRRHKSKDKESLLEPKDVEKGDSIVMSPATAKEELTTPHGKDRFLSPVKDSEDAPADHATPMAPPDALPSPPPVTKPVETAPPTPTEKKEELQPKPKKKKSTKKKLLSLMTCGAKGKSKSHRRDIP